MSMIPLFFEAPEAGKTDGVPICSKVRLVLFKNKIIPIPFASSVNELHAVLHTLRQEGQAPSIYVVNTYGAKHALGPLDNLMGATPVVFFRRTLYSGQSGFIHKMGLDPGIGNTASLLEKMSIRLTSIWFYGGKNADNVAELLASSLMRFLSDGEFRHIELANITRGR